MSDQDIQRYEQMLADDPGSRVFAPLADAYRKAGRLDDAIRTAKAGLRHNPHYSGGFVVLGRALFEKGELGPAAEAIIKAVEEAPENYLAQKTLAKISMAQGENARAMRALQAALLLSPDDMEVKSDIESLRGKVVHPGGIDFSSEDGAEDVSGGPVSAPLQADPEIQDIELPAEGVGAGGPVPEYHTLNPEQGAEALPLEEGEPLEDYSEAIITPEPMAEPADGVPEAETAVGEEARIPEFLSDLSVLPPAPAKEPAEVDIVPETAALDEENILTETLADLYAQQGVSDEAAQIYEHLLGENPEDEKINEKLLSIAEPQADEPIRKPTGEIRSEQSGSVYPAEDKTAGPGDPVQILADWLSNVERMKKP